tara:strand:- start:5657 stop:6130 length:474 start_codon:yes stop_codon:yes gene_type:complete
MNFKIIDNFLEKDCFDNIKKLSWDAKIPWYKGEVNDVDDSIYFTHILFDGEKLQVSYLLEKYKPLISLLEIKSLIRIKINYYPSNNVVKKHEYHFDKPFTHKGAIFSLNTCDGGTYIQDEFVPSIENRLLLFNPAEKHCSTDTTDKKGRMNINFNYF